MAYLFLLLYIFFIYYRPQEFGGFLYGIGVPWLNVIAAAIVISWAFSAKNRFVKAPQNTLVIEFFASIVLSQITNLWFGGALHAFSVMLSNIVLYFFVASLVNSEKKLKIFVWLLILLTTNIAVQGIIQSVTGLGVGGSTMIEGRITFIGTFNDPNEVALALIVVIPFLLAFNTREYSLVTRITSLVCLGINIYGIKLTDSRGGLVSFASVILFYCYRKFSKFQTIIICTLLFVAIPYVTSTRMTNLDVREESAHGRIAGMAHAFILLNKNIKNYIFGSGFGSIAEEYYFVAHNTLMQVAGETGIIGLFFFLSFIYCSCKSLVMIGSDTIGLTESLKPFATSLLASFIGYMVATLFITRCYNDTIYTLVGMAVAMTNIAQQKNSTLINSYQAKEMRMVFFASIAVLIISYIIVKIFY